MTVSLHKYYGNKRKTNINPILTEGTINLYENRPARIKIGRKLMEEF
jgi:hypothetical protein